MIMKRIGMKHIGLDAGSVSVKLVVLDYNGSILSSLYKRHKGQPLPVALEMLKTVMRDELCVTGNEVKDKDASRVMRHASRAFHDSSPVTHPASLSVTGSAGR